MTDSVTQDPKELRQLSETYGVPILAVHAPCLLITQRVWGSDPWGKLVRARQAAELFEAQTVVVHPPFRWQKEYTAGFVEGVALRETDTGMVLAVENMYPWRGPRQRELEAYAPHWDPVPQAYDHVTLDLSHTATAGSDALAMVAALGERLTHLHLADGLGSFKDEHLVPGRGGQPCAEVLETLAAEQFSGHVVVEVGTRRSDEGQRELDLAEALAFARLHLMSRVG